MGTGQLDTWILFTCYMYSINESIGSVSFIEYKCCRTHGEKIIGKTRSGRSSFIACSTCMTPIVLHYSSPVHDLHSLHAKGPSILFFFILKHFLWIVDADWLDLQVPSCYDDPCDIRCKWESEFWFTSNLNPKTVQNTCQFFPDLRARP